ncbi:hypothetical protein CBOM_01068 [Ceraceosorus bombacis]|uniref:Uncharacterized protein n=1 Tax=Ceraceosorus bombacis TaxID=401625 RepID=A0A0P1BCC2_9BASI|nr:hypothetical protein CBOM_01068 [Ceraceosorus bombacis]
MWSWQFMHRTSVELGRLRAVRVPAKKMELVASHAPGWKPGPQSEQRWMRRAIH